MLGTPFYHGHIRKLISVFGSLFDDIKVSSVDGGGIIKKVITVPIRYAGTDKLIINEPEPIPYIQFFPRMSFEVTGINYDAEKKVNPLNQIGNISSPSYYNIEFSLYILSRKQSDALQIIEQIIPFFNPTLYITMENSPIKNMNINIPITLNSISLTDDYEGEEDKERRVEWTINFTAQVGFFKDVGTDYENQIINFITKNYDPNDPTTCSPPRTRKIKKNQNKIETIIINEFIDIFDDQ